MSIFNHFWLRFGDQNGGNIRLTFLILSKINHIDTHTHTLKRLVATENPAFLCIEKGKIPQNDMYIYIYIYLYMYLSNFLILSKTNYIDTHPHTYVYGRVAWQPRSLYYSCCCWRTEIHFLSNHSLRSCHYKCDRISFQRVTKVLHRWRSRLKSLLSLGSLHTTHVTCASAERVVSITGLQCRHTARNVCFSFSSVANAP